MQALLDLRTSSQDPAPWWHGKEAGKEGERTPDAFASFPGFASVWECSISLSLTAAHDATLLCQGKAKHARGGVFSPSLPQTQVFKYADLCPTACRTAVLLSFQPSESLHFYNRRPK